MTVNYVYATIYVKTLQAWKIAQMNRFRFFLISDYIFWNVEQSEGLKDYCLLKKIPVLEIISKCCFDFRESASTFGVMQTGPWCFKITS